ncbi:MAG TPA: beta-galactosidase, partial [Ktedonobacteraceae bacterium]
GGSAPQGDTIAFTNYYITRNGRPWLPTMGEFHFSRFPHQHWKHELRKMHAGGIEIAASYIFWIHVEEEKGRFDWSGDRDVRAFVEACAELGLQVLLRIGPFAHGECRNGGLPDWLYGRAIQVRSNDERYLFYVRRFFAEIAAQVTGLLFKDSGPIIGIQIENEYGHSGAPWEVTFRRGSAFVSPGTDGVAHMQMLKQIAIEAGLEAPIYSCTAWKGAVVPEHGFLPTHAAYAFTPWEPDPEHRQQPTYEFLFRNPHARLLFDKAIDYATTQYPYVYSEMGSGNQITYHHRPVVPPECVQAMAIAALGSGVNLPGYYMYHGGSNPPGKHSYLHEYTVPFISYDFQAPIGEYGQLHQSYYRLRTLHHFLAAFGEMLAPMTVFLPEHAEKNAPEDTTTLRYAARSKDGSGFLFFNNYQDHVTMQDHEGIHLHLQLPHETLSLPYSAGFTLCKDVSAILPFNVYLEASVLLKYATAQLLTRVSTAAETVYVFFAPEGIRSEFALDKATYRGIEVTGGTLQEEGKRGYIVVEPGLRSCIDITPLTGVPLQVVVLTQEQAHTCQKVRFRGQELLILSDALVLVQDDSLHLYWRGQESTTLATYPPLSDDLVAATGLTSETTKGVFTHYRITAALQRIALHIQQPSPDIIRLTIPTTALDGLHDAFLRIDYVGDTGQAYLDGRLVSDHFANGHLPWEIGLKRFVTVGTERELVIRISPLHQNAPVLRYFPDNIELQAGEDGTYQVKVQEIAVIPEYHVVFG